jgi:hypothetical protein
MMQRVFIFLVVCLLMFCGEIFGQKFPEKNMVIPQKIQGGLPNSSGEKKCWIGIGQRMEELKKRRDSVCMTRPAYFTLHPVPNNLYASHLSFFCKKELQIEKFTAIPLRIRLGSLEYVNYLEQKPNSLRLY